MMLIVKNNNILYTFFSFVQVWAMPRRSQLGRDLVSLTETKVKPAEV